ncbi:MAG: 5-carboxymethyl-2-hydroxymuconate Delta-isomerase [Alicyclobacillus macrosporangiidus]|uniref:5-carboxymethyl-2-hydroxymuconate Delta-isomerase n=1 Tax=Alicyclobacillus macrosporangiidus TaxID=392015 RepID=UPI0026F1AB6E|nr:5-carboxymethyl-2-hydroxymuconate Delta-isomerase [Alicyclobacillus macrosporangiidus]MCL6599714.1 5-carboxymethyl-2-hydroxymuconate Delta-isomerase [Alicyclobacillus macrosporangiidus]
MPHLIVEYTDNIKADADIPGLLEKAVEALIRHRDVFPIGGIRARALELHEYRVADGQADDAFVHATLKIGAGRTEDEIRAAGDDLFSVIQSHFSDLMKRRYLALSMEIYEFSRPTYKLSNIHSRFQTRP